MENITNGNTQKQEGKATPTKAPTTKEQATTPTTTKETDGKETKPKTTKPKTDGKATKRATTKTEKPKKEQAITKPKKETDGTQTKKEQEQEQEKPTLTDWATLDEDQREELKSSLLKTHYGIGGDNISIFPNLLDGTTNPWVMEEYTNGLPKRVSDQQFKQWAGNGKVLILPLEIGNKIHYMVILQPDGKDITLDIWSLIPDQKVKIKYTEYKKVGAEKVGNDNFIISNIYTNKNKAYNQGKALTKLFKLGGNTFRALEEQKELKTNYLKKDISQEGKIIYKEIGKNGHKPTGKEFSTIEEFLGRKLPKEELNLINFIN